MKKKILLFMTVFTVIYAVSFICISSYTADRYSRYESMQKREIDALVVFFGDFNRNGDISDESMRRLCFSVDLYKKGTGRNIIFVGGWRPSSHKYGSLLMAKKAVEMGVKPDAVFHDLVSRDTINNWIEAEKIIRKNNFRSVLLVSSPLHLLRIETMIDPCSGINTLYAGYGEHNEVPDKNFLENLSEYNYNVVSIITYMVLPSGLYRTAIEKLRS